MNIKKKIADVSAELQTDELKKEVYYDIRQFVYKNQRQYYPAFKGELDDLVVDFYTEFTRKKKHRNGEEFSELDRFDYKKLGGEEWTGTDSKKLAAYVQRFVNNRLVDRARTDKGEVNYAEKYDEETGELSLDFLARQVSDPDEDLSNIQFSEEDIEDIRNKYNKMSKVRKEAFLQYLFNEVDVPTPEGEEPKKEPRIDTLAPNFRKLFYQVVGEDRPANTSKIDLTDESDLATEIHEQLPDLDANIEEHVVKGSRALRIVFSTAEEAKKADIEAINKVVEKEGYSFYVRRSNMLYFMAV